MKDAGTRPRVVTALLVAALFAVPILSGSAQAVPGQWDVPAAGLGGNGFMWAADPAPSSPTDLALRVEASWPPQVNVGDLWVVVYPFFNGSAGVQLPAGTTISDIAALSLDTYYESGVSCGGGSPRAQLAIDTDGDGDRDGNVFVYAGPFPGYSGCAQGSWTSNDLLDGAARFDATQIGGLSYGTQAAAAAVAGPAHQVLSARFVWDSPWMGSGTSIVWFDNLRVNGFLLDEPATGHACSIATGAGQSLC